MIPTLPQTMVMLALSMGKQPWIAPAVRARLVKRGWIAQCGTRVVSGAATGLNRDGGKARVPRRVANYDLTQPGKDALATSPHVDAARMQVRGGMQKVPWL